MDEVADDPGQEREGRVIEEILAEVEASDALPAPSGQDADGDESVAVKIARKRRRRRMRVAGRVIGSALRSVGLTLFTALLLATLFASWLPSLPEDVSAGLMIAEATRIGSMTTPTALPLSSWQRRVGVVSGHWGPEDDPGAVCDDGLTEAEVNHDIATRVVSLLRAHGYTVDLLSEFDERLEGYQAAALISIHADSCEYINDLATGFKVSGPAARGGLFEEDERLVNCLIEQYGAVTGLPFHPSVTADMQEYHTFREIAPTTPAAIIEVGFLYLDRQFLTQEPDRAALGIVAGLICFLEPTPTPIPTATQAAPQE